MRPVPLLSTCALALVCRGATMNNKPGKVCPPACSQRWPSRPCPSVSAVQDPAPLLLHGRCHGTTLAQPRSPTIRSVARTADATWLAEQRSWALAPFATRREPALPLLRGGGFLRGARHSAIFQQTELVGAHRGPEALPTSLPCTSGKAPTAPTSFSATPPTALLRQSARFASLWLVGSAATPT